jgi:hypothetical protein
MFCYNFGDFFTNSSGHPGNEPISINAATDFALMPSALKCCPATLVLVCQICQKVCQICQKVCQICQKVCQICQKVCQICQKVCQKICVYIVRSKRSINLAHTQVKLYFIW